MQENTGPHLHLTQLFDARRPPPLRPSVDHTHGPGIFLNIYARYFQAYFSFYKDAFYFYENTKCVQGKAILMPVVLLLYYII